MPVVACGIRWWLSWWAMARASRGWAVEQGRGRGKCEGKEKKWIMDPKRKGKKELNGLILFLLCYLISISLFFLFNYDNSKLLYYSHPPSRLTSCNIYLDSCFWGVLLLLVALLHCIYTHKHIYVRYVCACMHMYVYVIVHNLTQSVTKFYFECVCHLNQQLHKWTNIWKFIK